MPIPSTRTPTTPSTLFLQYLHNRGRRFISGNGVAFLGSTSTGRRENLRLFSPRRAPLGTGGKSLAHGVLIMEQDVAPEQRDDATTSLSNADQQQHTNGVNGSVRSNGTHADAPNGIPVENGTSAARDGSQSGGDLGFSKKRKHDSISKSGRSSRAQSPPWKKVAAEGPSSFMVDGKRKSGRRNELPVELQPASDQRRTRAAASTKSKARLSYAALHNGTPSSTQPKSAPKPPRDRRPSSSAKAMPQTEFKKPLRPLKPPPEPKASSHKRSGSSNVRGLPSKEKKPVSAPTKSQPRRHSRRSEDAAPSTPTRQPNGINGMYLDGASSENLTPKTFQRLKLRVRDPALAKTHPNHYPLPKKHASFGEWLETDDPLEGEPEARLTEQQVLKEARIRIRIARAAEPGGRLSSEKCTLFVPPPCEEPLPRYGHWNYVAAHAINFEKLLRKEVTNHRRTAKQVAIACQHAINGEDRWKFLREAKSADQIFFEERGYQIKRYQQVTKDVAGMWQLVRNEVAQIRQVKWLEEEEARGKKAMDDMLTKSNMLLNQNLHRDSSELASESAGRSSMDPYGTDGETGTEHGDEGSDTASRPEYDENMTDSSDGDDEDPNEFHDEDANLSPEALKRKYASVLQSRAPSDSSDASEQDSEDGQDDGDDGDEDEDEGADDDEATPNVTLKDLDTNSNYPTTDPDAAIDTDGETIAGDMTNGVVPDVEEVDEILLDDSDDSTDMDDDMGTSDDSDMETESGEEGEDEESDAEDGLMGFFGKGFAAKSKDNAFSNQEEGQDEDEDKEDELSRPKDEETTVAETPKTNGIHKSDISEDAEDETTVVASTPATPRTPNLPLKTEVPSVLLRGTLREYQHDGLDWLANLYVGKRNGILADEMGLGKTIQTISLLAHLAVHHGNWGPHLVVVPSSVILNWEIEFKKWCPGFKILTYYGDQEDRRRKRDGWLNDDKWNVIITSYQLILKDHQAFKRRAWHYLILDEAHNIKNFKSQRWQVMLTFKTHSRLLLTGTPLQNNLKELWSLLYFLMPAGIEGQNGFADLEGFLNSMKRPADQILDQGRQKLDEEAQERVNKLHEVLRPFLLRRLKSEVEKQMPGKYEHVVYCRLSKRQRQLYDEFMGRSDTKRTLSSGNYMSIINCLMSLRKVCNHPDLFETRQIVTSFAMPKSVVADYEIKELLVRRRLLKGDVIDLDYCGLVPTSNEIHSRLHSIRRDHLKPIKVLQELVARQSRKTKVRADSGHSTMQGTLAGIGSEAQLSVLDQLKNCAAHAKRTADRWPIYGTDLVKFLTMPHRIQAPPPNRRKQLVYSMGDWYLDHNTLISEMMPSLEEQAARYEILVRKFGCLTPAVVAEDVNSIALTPMGVDLIQQAQQVATGDPYHEGRMRLSIAFPDKRLLQYDCGKLQRLDKLLRQLQAGGHRCLIFTQMTKVLDILEQFLNIHGHRYLRLDGATKIEQRQMLTDRFNEDKSILAFILSSRSGGLGINLTGADTVIFYDLDWNPAMDAQCQDRAHRIGQTRDVHIYRFVSEYTIEANILRKSNQKRLLDDVIIQKGEFTTDYFNRVTYRDAFEDPVELGGEDAEASAAMDRVLGEVTGLGQVLESVEDKEDTLAAKAAQKEMILTDQADFSEVVPRLSGTPGLSTPVTGDLAQQAMEMEYERPHVDEYMLNFMMNELKDIVFVPKNSGDRKRDKKGKDWHKRRRR
jgi:helicase SWR1